LRIGRGDSPYPKVTLKGCENKEKQGPGTRDEGLGTEARGLTMKPGAEAKISNRSISAAVITKKLAKRPIGVVTQGVNAWR